MLSQPPPPFYLLYTNFIPPSQIRVAERCKTASRQRRCDEASRILKAMKLVFGSSSSLAVLHRCSRFTLKRKKHSNCRQSEISWRNIWQKYYVDIAHEMTEAKTFTTFIIACSPLKRKRLDRQHSKIINKAWFKGFRRNADDIFFSGPSGYLKMETTGYHETSVWNDHSTLRNIPEQCTSYLHKVIIKL